MTWRSSPKLIANVTLLVSLMLVAASTFVHGMNPLLVGQNRDECLPIDMPASEVCFPTRCIHLFNMSKAGQLTPTPVAWGKQRYPSFHCNVSTYYEYAGFVKRACLRPVCVCNRWYAGGSCFPARDNGCLQHKCVRNARSTLI